MVQQRQGELRKRILTEFCTKADRQCQPDDQPMEHGAHLQQLQISLNTSRHHQKKKLTRIPTICLFLSTLAFSESGYVVSKEQLGL